MNVEKNKILIVDDFIENLQIACNILQSAGYSLSIASNGSKAIEIARNFLPDLILLDIMMPEMDGYEVCAYLKNNELTKEIPIIFLTAKIEPGSIGKAFEMGAVDYIAKPFNEIELLARVKTHIDLKRSMETIKEQNHQMEALIQSREKLFSIIAHDLKSPLSNLIGFSDILLRKFESFPPEKTTQFVKIIYDSAKRGNDLLENLLEWSRIQTGRLVASLIDFDIHPVIMDCLALYESTAKSKEIEIDNQVQKEAFVYADINMVKTILRNLISNALKFTFPFGKISIMANQMQDNLSISILDNGVGMNSEDINKLFDPQLNFSKVGTKKEKGSGLGLVLCDVFVKENNGKIEVYSTVGKGSEFKLTIPLSKQML